MNFPLNCIKNKFPVILKIATQNGLQKFDMFLSFDKRRQNKRASCPLNE